MSEAALQRMLFLLSYFIVLRRGPQRAFRDSQGFFFFIYYSGFYK
ncbi:MAG: hypothetical protein ACI9KF_001204 [Arenicella sp.]